MVFADMIYRIIVFPIVQILIFFQIHKLDRMDY